jgi:hypothetical protein
LPIRCGVVSAELVQRIGQKTVERVGAAILVPTGWRGGVDVDARVKRRVILAHSAGHQAYGLRGDPAHLLGITLDHDGIVDRQDHLVVVPRKCLGPDHGCAFRSNVITDSGGR